MKFKIFGFLFKVKTLMILIFLDLITTYTALLIGGVEYNKISLAIMSYSHIGYIIVKILSILILYILDKKTDIFKFVYTKSLLFVVIIIYLIVVILNSVYIYAKLIGMI